MALNPVTACASTTFCIGQLVAERFVILEELGDGFYLAQDRQQNRRVTVQICRRELMRDCVALRGCGHSNVCRIFEFFEAGEASFYSAEYVAGRRLSEELAAGHMDARRAEGLDRQIAEGLYALHQMGLAHGDLRAEDIVLTGRGTGERAVIHGFGRNRPRDLEECIEADLVAFGQVLLGMNPQSWLARRCMSASAEVRPSSFGEVIAELRTSSTERQWMDLLVSVASASVN
jgi:serine/threonine protein kinase